MCFHKKILIKHEYLFNYYLPYYFIHIIFIIPSILGLINLIGSISNIHYNLLNNFDKIDINKLCNYKLFFDVFEVNLSIIPIFILFLIYLIIEPLSSIIYLLINFLLILFNNFLIFYGTCNSNRIQFLINLGLITCLSLLVLLHYIIIIRSNKINCFLHILIDLFFLPFFLIYKPISYIYNIFIEKDKDNLIYSRV